MKNKKLYSVLHLKCPKCHKGDLFINNKPYKLSTFDKMHDKCPNCGEDFVRENGFYWGAMMISHANTTIVAVIIHVIFYLLYGWDEVWLGLFVTILVLLLLFPITFRTSRAIWINIFVDFDSKYLS